MKIKNIDNEVICDDPKRSVKMLAEDNRDILARADLRGANLQRANLWGAYLIEANLEGADLEGANLEGADLEGANLEGTDLIEANLKNARLKEAKVEFRQFPSIRFLSGLSLGSLSDELTLELMRRDAYAHPHPEKFDEWAKNKWGGRGLCPYDNSGMLVERFWRFKSKRKLWEPGLPQMTDKDLIVAICREKGWKLKHR